MTALAHLCYRFAETRFELQAPVPPAVQRQCLMIYRAGFLINTALSGYFVALSGSDFKIVWARKPFPIFGPTCRHASRLVISLVAARGLSPSYRVL